MSLIHNKSVQKLKYPIQIIVFILIASNNKNVKDNKNDKRFSPLKPEDEDEVVFGSGFKDTCPALLMLTILFFFKIVPHCKNCAKLAA